MFGGQYLPKFANYVEDALKVDFKAAEEELSEDMQVALPNLNTNSSPSSATRASHAAP